MPSSLEGANGVERVRSGEYRSWIEKNYTEQKRG